MGRPGSNPGFANQSHQSVRCQPFIPGHHNIVRTRAVVEVADLIVPPPKLAYTAALRCHKLFARAFRMYRIGSSSSVNQEGHVNERIGPHQCGAASDQPLNLLSLTNLRECLVPQLPASRSMCSCPAHNLHLPVHASRMAAGQSSHTCIAMLVCLSAVVK